MIYRIKSEIFPVKSLLTFVGANSQVRVIETALTENPNLKVTVLLDCLRGTRNVAKNKSDATLSSVTILRPLVQQFPNRVRIASMTRFLNVH
jgi:hypothetical protein